MISEQAQLIYGRNAVEHWLKQDASRMTKVWLAEGVQQDRRLQAIQRMAKQAGIAVLEVPRSKLEKLIQNAQVNEEEQEKEAQGKVAHQGVVAKLASQPLLSLQELLGRLPNPLGNGLILMLDGVTDTQNLGAILRVADAAGVWGVIIGKHRSATLGPQVAKAACGADAVVPVAQVTNLRQALEALKSAGFWSVASVCESNNTVVYTQLDYAMPTVLLLGSEGKGLSPQLIKACDFHVTIPMAGTINSLNVATACAVLSFQIREKQAKQS